MIVRKLAGYSLGRGDLIRRAMGKKKQSIMDKEREIFLYGNKNSMKEGELYVPGCIENGIEEKAAIVIWDKMAEFAKYAFNKSHSAGYAVITVQTAWLKLYYPIDFLMATLNSVINKQDKLMFYISDARNLGIEILGPDVNKSEALFSIEGTSIRTGLKALRNVGKMSIPVLNERKNNGEFKSLDDFIDRLISDIDKRVLESLIYSGALDCFEGTRNSKISAVPDILEFVKNIKKGTFSEIHFKLPIIDEIYIYFKSTKFEPVPEFEKKYLLEKEYFYAGMYISGHPLDEYKELLATQSIVKIKDILPEETDDLENKAESQKKGQKVSIAGIIRDNKPITTKKMDKMYICSIEDETGEIKSVIFPRVANACEEHIQDGNLVIVEGTVDDNDRGCQIIVGNIKNIESLKFDSIKKLYINCPSGIPTKLKEFIRENKGTTPVSFQVDRTLVPSEVSINLDWNTFAALKKDYQIKLA